MSGVSRTGRDGKLMMMTVISGGGFLLPTNAINTVGVISCKKGRRYLVVKFRNSLNFI
jgi:hypothetical protein